MALSSFAQSGLSRVTTTSNAIISGTVTGSFTSGSDTFNFYTFNANGTLSVFASGLADILIVSGGGAGGGAQNGNSGAGYGTSVLTFSAFLPQGDYTVTVGGGGAGAVWNSTAPANGTASTLVRSGIISLVGLAGMGGVASTCCSPSDSRTAANAFANTAGTASSITNSSVTYGAYGAAAPGLNLAAVNGAANTGNGGGATWQQGNGAGGNGGSGRIIVRVKV